MLHAGEKFNMMSCIAYSLLQVSYNDHVMEDEMREAYIHGKESKCIRSFGKKTWKVDTTRRILETNCVHGLCTLHKEPVILQVIEIGRLR
jgi:hypothetical protein